MTVVLQVETAFKQFGSVPALKGADVVLRQGELLALLGPNGAGKTTLIGSIAGRVRLDAGSVRLFGQTMENGNSAQRRRLGIVPQEIALYPLLTASQNLDAFGRFNGLTGADLKTQIASALEWTGLADRA